MSNGDQLESAVCGMRRQYKAVQSGFVVERSLSRGSADEIRWLAVIDRAG